MGLQAQHAQGDVNIEKVGEGVVYIGVLSDFPGDQQAGHCLSAVTLQPVSSKQSIIASV